MLSGLKTLDAARDNLKLREKAVNLADIHWATTGDAHTDDDVSRDVRTWLAGQANLDAVIWTGLKATLTGNVVAKAIAYLTALDPMSTTFQKAREYITKTPAQIQTAVRREMQQRGWLDVIHPDDLFE